MFSAFVGVKDNKISAGGQSAMRINLQKWRLAGLLAPNFPLRDYYNLNGLIRCKVFRCCKEYDQWLFSFVQRDEGGCKNDNKSILDIKFRP